MTASLRIAPYNDHDDCTLSVNVTLPDGFEAENTQNTVRSDVLRTSDTTTLVVTGVAPANRVANCFFLFRHLLAGASVRLQLFTDTGASVAATGGDSGTNAAIWWTASEPYTWSDGSNDRFASEAPYRYYFGSDVTYRSYKLTVSGTPSAVSYYQIGRIVIGRYMELARSLKFGAQSGRKSTSRSNRTDGGTKRSYRGASWRTLEGDLAGLTPSEFATWEDFMQEVDTTKDFAISLYPSDGDRKEALYTLNATLANLNVIGHEVGVFTGRIQVEEV